MNIILWGYESVWYDIWPKNKCMSLWPIFHGPVILSYIMKTYSVAEHHTLGNESVWPYIWPQNICRSLWPVFHGPLNHCDLYFMVLWICLIFWRLFDVWTSYFGIMSQYDTTLDLRINVDHCDLYFMVQWFSLIHVSWRLFDVWSIRVAERLALTHSRGRGFESHWRRDSSRNGASLHRAFHVHPPIVSKWLKYCWRDVKP